MTVPTNQKNFFANINNEYRFISMLSDKLTAGNITVKQGQDDADILIIETAREKFNGTNTTIVVSEDVDFQNEMQDAQNSLQTMTITEGGEHSVTKKAEVHKIDIFLKPIANAPIMKKQKWSVDSSKPISWILWFVAKYMKLEPEEKLFLYVNQVFAPAPDQILKNLYDCYATEGKLVLHYCKTQAWG
ncbi:hypothetical protein WA026_016213 [Henosepilachna vigintioctopunctata]|uniref:Ubiquitin-like protein ATG12 n=1 Tax=Henosepilachna vigintioctopunctata TaxID=420089 RepID=A0AAW1TYE3_9CUCU